MNKIQLLPEHIIDQIKAGEVIERPASLIKELLENAVDAGATKISANINNNGLDLISIEDNGCGINIDDLPFAFCRHATSKIARFEDLANLNSYGFRGEALASIASIAKVSCSCATIKGDGGKIVIHGGKEISHTPNNSKDHGTSLYISDLFYNTPARLKFIKSKKSERNAIQRVLNSFILSCTHITWSFKFDDHDRQIFKAEENNQARIKHIFKTKQNVITNTHEYDNHQIITHVSAESGMSSTGKSQYIIINNRLISDSQLHRTIIRNLSSFWKGGIGHYFIELSIPAAELDVNIHPSKTMVKFHQPSVVFSLVSSSLKKMTSSQKVPITPRFQSSLLNNGSDFKGLQPLLNSERNNETSHGNLFIQIFDDYFLLKNDQELPMLLKGTTLFSYYFNKRVEDLFPLTDSQITPLLISEPITNKKSDPLFPILSQMGFDIDRLDNHTLALRSIPSFALIFSQYIISSLKKLDQLSYQSANTHKISLAPLFSEDFILSNQQLEMICNNIPISELIEMNAITILKKENLNKLLL